jgi:hypothetical protein
MGLLTDIFAASLPEVQSLTKSEMPGQKFPSLQAKNLDPVKFARLQHILAGTEVQAAVRQQKFVRTFSEDGPWITEVSDPLFAGLCALDADQAIAAAGKWSQIEEFRLDRWKAEDVSTVARAEGKRLFVWTCL